MLRNKNPAVLLQVPVPQALCLCQDASVVGTPFYVMSFVSGRVYDDLALPELAPADRYQVRCCDCPHLRF